MKEQINEEMNLEKEWYAEAAKQTLKTLPGFINHVMNDYIHDYGTVCKAIAACAIAAAWAANEENGAQGKEYDWYEQHIALMDGERKEKTDADS